LAISNNISSGKSEKQSEFTGSLAAVCVEVWRGM
jgi:hypothetical protein